MPKPRKFQPIFKDRPPAATSHQAKPKAPSGHGAQNQLKAHGGVKKHRKPGQWGHGAAGHGQHAKHVRAAGKLQCMSIVDRQAAAAMQALVEADAGRAKGAR